MPIDTSIHIFLKTHTHISVNISMHMSVHKFMNICAHPSSSHWMYSLIYQWMVNEYIYIWIDVFIDVWSIRWCICWSINGHTHRYTSGHIILISVHTPIEGSMDSMHMCIYNINTTSLIYQWRTIHRYTSIDTLIDASINVFLKRNYISVHISMGYISGRIQEYMHTSVHTSIE